MDEKIVKHHFDEWVELLKHAKHEELLDEPYSVWLEAWHVCTMIRALNDQKLQEQQP
jgi:hypothetical protein